MDVRFFLHKRTAFIRQLYATASAPFIERKRRIETKEEPYVPPYSEDGEPAFLEEWLAANDSMQALAYACVSMLASALHLYLKTWEREIGNPIDEANRPVFKSQGWLHGYKVHFAGSVGIRFENSPTDLKLLEEVVLARHRIQHPESLVMSLPNFSDSNLRNLRHPFFVDDRERALLLEVSDEERSWLLPPTLHVSEEKLAAAITAVESFGEWLDAEVYTGVFQRAVRGLKI